MNIVSFFYSKSRYKKLITQYPNAIIMFSEGNVYQNTNYPILDELTKKNEVIYLTLDPKDTLLENSLDHVHSFLVSLDILGSFFLKTLSAKLFITTTPGLGSLALKKSKKIIHYSYYMHAPVGIHRYQQFSFDCFDSIVCSGDFQMETLSYLEQYRNFPQKEKIVLGVPYYDIMLKEYQKNPILKDDQYTTILIAPSWGDNNFLNYYQKDIIQELLDQNYKVILRFHPQSYCHEPHLVNVIIAKHKNHLNFSIDKSISNVESMKKSDLLISSYSGMIFDFIFLTEKPCILFDTLHIGSDFEGKDINFLSWETLLMPNIGKLVSLDEDINISAILSEINSKKEMIITNIQKARSEIANFGNASTKIAEFYLNKIGALND